MQNVEKINIQQSVCSLSQYTNNNGIKKYQKDFKSYKKNSDGNAVSVEYNKNSNGKSSFNKKHIDKNGKTISEQKLQESNADKAIADFENVYKQTLEKNSLHKKFKEFIQQQKIEQKQKQISQDLEFDKEFFDQFDQINNLFYFNQLFLENLFCDNIQALTPNIKQ